jgi:acetyl-CoA acetyltransferase
VLDKILRDKLQSMRAYLLKKLQRRLINFVARGWLAVAFGYNSIKCGDANIVVAGGQESMSNAPHFINLRNGVKLGDTKLQELNDR